MSMDRCPNCGATLQVDKIKKIRYCEYCGTTFSLEDLTQTVRYIDEARLKEAQLKEQIFQAEQREQEERQVKAKKEKKMRRVGIALAAVGAIALLSSGGSPSILLILIGCYLIYANGGRKTERPQQVFTQPVSNYDQQEMYYYSSKDKLVALLLCIFGGYFGLHQFYAGRIGKGILYLFTGGLFGIGYIVDIVLIATGRFKDRDKRYIK